MEISGKKEKNLGLNSMWPEEINEVIRKWSGNNKGTGHERCVQTFLTI